MLQQWLICNRIMACSFSPLRRVQDTVMSASSVLSHISSREDCAMTVIRFFSNFRKGGTNRRFLVETCGCQQRQSEFQFPITTLKKEKVECEKSHRSPAASPDVRVRGTGRMDLRQQPTVQQLQRWVVRLLQSSGIRCESLCPVRLLLAGRVPLPACTNLQTGIVSTSGRTHARRFA